MEYVVKVGGSILTRKKQGEKTLSKDFQKILSQFQGHENGVIVHGAGSYGHPQAEKHGLKNGSFEGALEVHTAVSELDTHVLEELSKNGLKPVPVNTSSIAYREPETRINLENIEKINNEGFSPVLHGDIIPQEGEGFSIISGDEIVVKLQQKYKADKVGFCTSEKGVLNSQGEVIDEINDIDDFPSLEVEGKDVTGGMKGKIREILESGVQARIFGKEELREFLEGEEPGTLVR